MKDCKDCGRKDVMYERENDYRCAVCGWTFSNKTGVANDIPSKPHNANCGELLKDYPEDDQTPRVVKRMNNDGGFCSFNPNTIEKREDGNWYAVCGTHKSD